MTEPQSTEIIQPQQQASAPARPDMVRFGGYDREQTDMLLERYWNQMQGYRRSLAQQLGVSDRQQTRIGQLEGQLEAAVAERDQLRHRADNPYEAAGQAAQQMVDTARDKAKGMLANAEKEAERALADPDGIAGGPRMTDLRPCATRRHSSPRNGRGPASPIPACRASHGGSSPSRPTV